MDWEKGLFGSGWQDYQDQHIQPLLDHYDGQINDILSGGAHGEIARIQATDDALGPGNPANGATKVPAAGENQQDGSWYSPFGTYNPDDNTATFGVPASQPADSADKSKLFGGLATAFGGTGLAADLSSAAATSIGKAFGGGGDTAALRGLEKMTGRVISTPLNIAEGVADTLKDVSDGYTPAESILGNLVRGGVVYGGGALAGTLGGFPGIAVGAGLDYALPSGGAIGRSILKPPPSKYDYPTTIMLMAK